MSFIKNFRSYLDLNRKSTLYKILSPIKNFIAENYSQKECWYFPELKAIYIHSPKCAGTTIYKTLGKKYEYIRINKKKASKLKAFKFTFVRNPYSRVVSAYAFLIKNFDLEKYGILKDATFGEFIQKISLIKDHNNSDIHFKTILRNIEINSKITYLDFVGKLENFEKDFKHLCNKLEIQYIKPIHANMTPHKYWKEFYEGNKDFAKIVYKKYKKDFNKFGYKKDSWL